MIYSMTGFARSQHKGDWGTAIWELRSVNHRYLDVSIKMPDNLRDLENAVRERLREAFGRGKIEAYLKFQAGPAITSELNLNEQFVTQLSTATSTISTSFPSGATINVMDVLKWPGLIDLDTEALSAVHEHVLAALDEAIENLKEMRMQEGQAIAKMLTERLDEIAVIVKDVRKNYPTILAANQKKLVDRLAEVQEKLDKDRLEQEMVYFAQRIDVAEELDRLDAHLSEIKKVLKKGGLVGRRLDFFMQELNREANTLSSKSQVSEQTHASVDMKVLIEQMREQVQNVE